MQVEVKLFSGLEKLVPGVRFGQPVKIDITERSTVRTLLGKLSIPEKDVYIILVNGVNKGFDENLADGDCISIFPPVGGG